MSINDSDSKFTGASEGAAFGGELGDVARRMIELGATYSQSHVVKYQGAHERNFTYFFEPGGLEIGYYNHTMGSYLVHNEPRKWSAPVRAQFTSPESLDIWRRK